LIVVVVLVFLALLFTFHLLLLAFFLALPLSLLFFVALLLVVVLFDVLFVVLFVVLVFQWKVLQGSGECRVCSPQVAGCTLLPLADLDHVCDEFLPVGPVLQDSLQFVEESLRVAKGFQIPYVQQVQFVDEVAGHIVGRT
jgi:hypothetical protein